MKVIHKYKLDKTVNHITVPEDSDLFHIHYIGVQDNDIFIWIELDTDYVDDPDDHESTTLTLVVVGTGERFEDVDEDDNNMYYINTVLVPPFVWHIYESSLTKHQPEEDEQ